MRKAGREWKLVVAIKKQNCAAYYICVAKLCNISDKTQHAALNLAKPTTAWRGVRKIQHRDIFKSLHLHVPRQTFCCHRVQWFKQ